MVVIDIGDVNAYQWYQIGRFIMDEANSFGHTTLEQKQAWIKSYYGFEFDPGSRLSFDTESQALYFMIKFGLTLHS